MEKKLEAAARLLEVMDTLREKCPWDREQTFHSLRNNTIEETFELVDAITDENMEGIKEELGDLLLHIVFYSKLGEEQGAFDFADVANAECDKLIYRHPHVYGDVHADAPEEVLRNWEALKLRKKARKSGILGGVPRSLPAMVKAFRVGEKAASAGFDWEKREDVWDKVREEVSEVETEIRSGAKKDLEAEFGDLFFALINACRLYGIDPENALERTNKKFIHRFNHIEQRCAEQGKMLGDTPLDELETYWQEAKVTEQQISDTMAYIKEVRGHTPEVGEGTFLAETAVLIGDVKIGKDSSIWYNTVLRGDVNTITVGDRTNIQDGTVIHTLYDGSPHPSQTHIGNDVSVGHNATIHGAIIEDNCLIGMGATILDNAVVATGCIIAANALVLSNSKLEPNSVYAGVPAKKVKEVTPEQREEIIRRIARDYHMYASWYGEPEQE